MSRICYLLLCHKNPERVIAQVQALTAHGDFVVLHFDARGSGSDFQTIKQALSGNAAVAFTNRVKCGWGEWSLVKATINAAQTGLMTFAEATHFYLISGDCQPIKTAAEIQGFLADNDCDFIEHHDFLNSNWIKVGMKEDRLRYRHWFNERTRKPLFYASLTAQRTLKWQRSIPRDLRIMIGSQWWCLRRNTLEKVLRFASKRKDVTRFFRTTWIPDEIFFQTLVVHLTPKEEICNETLTFLHFSDYGLPTVFYDDHFEFLISQRQMFARKITGTESTLRDRLATHFVSGKPHRQGPDGRALIGYLSGRGRKGRRYAERFWERGSRIGERNQLLVVVCKKWHVGKRFAAAAAMQLGAQNLGYVFAEGGNLPHLGHISDTSDKRNRNRRAFLQLMYDHFQTRTLVIGMDPSNFGALADLASDSCEMRVLEVDCQISTAYLRGHADRIGLEQQSIGEGLQHATLYALHHNILEDSAQLRDLDGAKLFTIREVAPEEPNAVALASFLDISMARAHTVLETLSFD